jgi:hypothetical protein
VFGKIALGQFDDLLLFSIADGIRYSPELVATSGFDFNEYQGALVFGDKVQFSSR